MPDEVVWPLLSSIYQSLYNVHTTYTETHFLHIVDIAQVKLFIFGNSSYNRVRKNS